MINWVKNNKLLSLLILVVLFLLFKDSLPTSSKTTNYSVSALPVGSGGVGGLSRDNTMVSKTAPQAETAAIDRMVIKNSNLSLVVKDVSKTGEEIVAYAVKNGGYMVSASYNKPSDSPFGTIEVRIPSDKLDQALKYFRGLSIKVSSETIYGLDITNQYKDIEARLATLKETQTKFKEILDKATQVQDILSVQRELMYIQDQIDALIGEKKALEENVKLTKITVYLSTDELALPYTPDKTFRPSLIFKQATRSMLGSLQFFGQVLIWIFVYSIIWVPLLVLYIFYRRRRKNKT